MDINKDTKNNTEITQNNGKIVDKNELFDEKGRFKKGHPKIGGKELGSKHKPKFLDELEEMLDELADGKDYTYRKALKKQILKRMIIDGDTTLLREYWQQRDGKPIQKNEITGKDGDSINIRQATINAKDATEDEIDNFLLSNLTQ